MTDNKGNQKEGLASSSIGSVDYLKNLFNLMNFEDANMDVVFPDDEIHKVAMEEEGSDEAKNMLANQSKTPATDNNQRKIMFYYPTKEMEDYYKICPRPDEKQRRELAEELGIHPLQVMFWFKNKRKQMRTHRAYVENSQLRAENKNLEDMKLKENICSCACKGRSKEAIMMLPENHELIMENESLKEEYSKLLLLVRNFCNSGSH